MQKIIAGGAFAAACCLIVSLEPLSARSEDEEWTGWRGSRRDGTVEGFLPRGGSWPMSLELVWRIDVGDGHSAPVSSGDLIYLHHRMGEDEVTSAFDLETGQEVWSQSYPVSYRAAMGAGRHGRGPKATPALAGQRLVTLGITGVLSVWDRSSGELHWRLQFDEDLKKGHPHYGMAVSPLIDGDRLIVHGGRKGDAALLALGVEDGSELWHWSREGPSYASPILTELGGQRQIVTVTARSLVGIDADDGALLWSVPFPQNAFSHNMVTPVAAGELLILSGEKRGITALRPRQREAGEWVAETVWERDDLAMEMSTPVVHENRLFGLAHQSKGTLVALDLEDGRTRWASPGRQAGHASLIWADGALLVLTEEGELRVLEAGNDRFEVLASYSVADSPTFAHPALLAGGRIVIKSKAALALWRVPAP